MEIPFMQKYQPMNLKDFEIEPHLFDLINTFINIDSLNILFVADSGSGKSSIIFAIMREYYKENYDETNILYINSLKEQGISFYRNDVKTFCQTKCSIPHKKKIIVLDDLDIINEQSQQVFRNCIDKYSHNVHFISSCSNIQKVIESLQSRLTILRLQPLKKEDLQSVLNKIKKSENIQITKDAEDFILNISNNTVKILINYMEKFLLLNKPINLELANLLCSNISFVIFEEYTNYIIQGELTKGISLVYDLIDKGYSVMDVLDNYFMFVKSTNMLSEEQKYNIIPCICKYITIFHNIHEDEIELSLFTNNIIQLLSKTVIQ